MKFGYTIFYVKDVKATVAFYEKALNLKCKFMHESGEYAEMDTGETALAFASESLREMNGVETLDNRLANTSPGVEIGFEIKDVEKAFNYAVQNGAVAINKPTEKPWGQAVAYVKDINGILIAFGSPIEV